MLVLVIAAVSSAPTLALTTQPIRNIELLIVYDQSFMDCASYYLGLRMKFNKLSKEILL